MSAERDIKHQRVGEWLDRAQAGAVVLSRRCNFSWYTCGAHNYVGETCDVGNSHLVVTADRACVVANNIEAPRLRAELAIEAIEVTEVPYFEPERLAAKIREVAGTDKLAADVAPTGVDASPTDRNFDQLRWTLTDWELTRYRKLAADVVAAVETTVESIEPLQREEEVAGLLQAMCRQESCVPWVCLVGADERLQQFRHPLPTDKPIRKAFMAAVCAERDGLIAACSRVMHFGKIPADLADRHEAVCRVDAALIGATRPGATLGEIFATAREAYEDVGHADQWTLHHQGGSIGYLPREVKAAPGEATQALARQPFAWNPSITGTKSEDTILCRSEGEAEILGAGTDWPTLQAEWGGKTFLRPAIGQK